MNDQSPRRGRVSGGFLGRLTVAVGLVLTALGARAGWAQAGRSATKFYPDFSDTADTLLRNAAGHVRDGQWAEAVEIYQRVVKQFGDKVARLPKDEPAGDPSGDSVLYVDVRDFCQRRLAALPPEGRAVYRGRVDAEAERWFRQGAAGRDRGLLRRVVEQAFCSSWGDDAVELLGDLAFQDGRFEEALAHYRRLVADVKVEGAGAVHPDPGVDLARVAAKKLLCRAALGQAPPAEADVAEFARAYPGARGALAGRVGPYAETLRAALKGDRLAPPAESDGRWPTFAGAPSRTRVLPDAVDVGSLQWRVDLNPVKSGGGPRGYRGVAMAGGPTRPDKLLAYHPIVLGDQVIVCDDGQVVAYNLNDRPEGAEGGSAGSVRPAWRHDDEAGGGPTATRFPLGIPRFTLTASGDRVYARMGLTSIPYMGRGMGAGSHSYLVALDRSTDGKLLWKKPPGDVLTPRRPGDQVGRNLGFEGTPVADARGVYVALTERREQTATYVACLDPETGAPRWVRYVGAASAEGDHMFGMGMGMGIVASNDSGHRLLTLDGPTIYYQTNLGAVGAIDAETGLIRWVATYPRHDRGGSGSHDRDLNPAVVHGGLVIVAPDDSNVILAYEAASGRLVWKTDPLPDEVKLAHLLGVAKGRLVATGDRVLLFDVKDGKLLHSWPDGGHGYDGYGRGLLAGDKIYWPTRNEIHVLDQGTGLRPEPPIRLLDSFQETGGNLAAGDGYLVVAQERRLVVFCQNRRLIRRYREEIAHAPDRAAPRYRLARAAEATGDDRLALESLNEALDRAGASESVDGAPLSEAVRDQKFRLLLKMGDKARAAGDLASAEELYHQAGGVARQDRDRLRARLAEADAQAGRGADLAAVTTWQSVLADARLRGLNVTTEEGRRTVRADLLAGARLAALLKARGRAVYGEFDRAARRLFERGSAREDAGLLAEVSRNYPAAEVVPEAWLALARLSESKHQPGEAVRAYKRLLAAAGDEPLRAVAVLGLARAYEAEKLWGPAREAYAQLAARYAAVPVPGEGAGSGRGSSIPAGALASARLSRPPFDRLGGGPSEPKLPTPLVRTWAGAAVPGGRPLPADGLPPSPDAGGVFLASGSVIRPAAPPGGGGGWSADLEGTPVWVGYLDDRVVAATEDRVVALDLSGGGPVWRFAADGPRTGRGAANPFDRPATAAREEAAPRGKLHGFRIVAGRLIFLRDDDELVALDGDTGQLDWSFRPAGGSINPNLLVTPEKALLQTRRPNAVLVLETATGRRLGEFPQAEEEEWPRPPLPLDEDRAALVIDRRTVGLFDTARGVNCWVFRESEEMPKNGPPRLLGDAERLLLVHDGNELIRLDAAAGVKLWSRPLGVEDLGERPGALAVDGDSVYWASNRTVNRAWLRDGSLSWTRFLTGPESGWSVGLTARCVLAYPAAPAHDGPAGGPLSLVFRRRADGALVQRVALPASGPGPAPRPAVRLGPRGVLVATGEGVWALGERSPVDGARGGR